MRIRLRLFPFRSLILLIPLLLLVLIYKDAILDWFIFDVNAPDLAGMDAQALKIHIFKNLLFLDNTLFFYNFYQSFMFPMIAVVMAYEYRYINERYLRYRIGRTKDYEIARRSLKFQLTAYQVGIFLSVLSCLLLVAFFWGRVAMEGLPNYFAQNSVLRLFGEHTWLYLIFYSVVKVVAIMMNSWLVFAMVDYFNHFIKASLFYLIFIWALCPLLYAFLPFYLVPMSSYMITSYGGINLPIVFLPYTLFICLIMFMKVTKKYEVL
ncbi:hypothetical protein [Streptococcus himalayensis]|uniref:hypothetical protein n=1 Tax=Streptococcus himalayensis TaxID=1888195 RepID=UPI00083DA303|nr:hypothetical protein [Streptococcus himalayensis]